MPGSVIVSSARTPIGKLSGALASFSRPGPRRVRDQGRARARRRRPRAGRLRGHGPGAPGRPGPDHRPPGGGEGRRPDDGARDHDQQGVPLGHQRDLPRRPDDAGGRRRGRGRRRHGVDDERALPAPRRACRLPHGQRRARRLDDQRRPVVRVRRRAHGRRHREVRRPGRRDHPRGAGRARGPEPRAGRRRRSRKAASPTRSPRSRSRSARATRSLVDTDEGVRPGTTAESLGGLRPAFSKDGTITAGNASQISDGGAAVDRDEPRRRRRSSAPRRSPSWSASAWSPGPTRRCSRSRRVRSSGRSRPSTRRSPTSTCSSSTRRSPRSGSRR